MSNYPDPCAGCAREQCRAKNCIKWKTRYLYRQKQINAYAKHYGIVPGSPDYVEGQNPCDVCLRNDVCANICQARADYWDERMALVRKGLGL